MRKRVYKATVDYRQPGLRRRLAYYLKAGSFRHIAGHITPARSAQRYRLILIFISIILTLIGLYNVFF